MFSIREKNPRPVQNVGDVHLILKKYIHSRKKHGAAFHLPFIRKMHKTMKEAKFLGRQYWVHYEAPYIARRFTQTFSCPHKKTFGKTPCS